MIESVEDFKQAELQALLRDPEAFKFCTGPMSDGYFVHFSRTGRPNLSVGFDTAAEIGAHIRKRYPAIADRIVACIEKGRREAGDSR